MGADGGSIPRREELVKLKAKAEKVDPKEIERVKWSTCAISNQILKEPIVACNLGNLYNKEVILKHLLEKTIPSSFSHVKSLKDLLTIHPKKNPNVDESNLAVNDKALFICPITGLEVGNNSYKFVAIKGCGCVLSERAIRECGASTTCLVCSKPFSVESVLKLAPEESELKIMKEKLLQSKESTDKKRKKNKESTGTSETKEKKNKKEVKEEKKSNEKKDSTTDKEVDASHKKRKVEEKK
eukprot:TRINITY_DN7544_c0_g2_i1.p1 TRINITY_DN7544_c0_g2~~TRINITY_DN7544_c0_g2_i1.p1  ORF type:complete len:256 (+),score=95.36 TRINITY_DN7544_c0_g2_i1:48-770(+)